MSMNGGGAVQQDVSTRTRQQTSSRMMKTTRRGRPYAKDTHDLFATLVVSLQLTTHRQYFKTYHNSFTTDEAAENLSALKFSQSNRAPDPKEPSRVVTTTTTTTFSMNREMAKGICQHFMDARLIENAGDLSSTVFKDKGVYVLTPKGLHILERFITKNGINGEHLLKVFSTQPICMKLLHLERRSHDDELLINRPVIEVIFRRFVGRQPNYAPRSDRNADPATPNEFDRTMGVEMNDIYEKVKGKGLRSVQHTFPAISALDWLCDFTTICGRDEAAEIAAHFVRLNLIELIVDRTRRDPVDTASIIVRGDDGQGRLSEGEFRCHYKAVYGMTDRGRAVARWDGYREVQGGSGSGSQQGYPNRDSPAGSSYNVPAGANSPAVAPPYPLARRSVDAPPSRSQESPQSAAVSDDARSVLSSRGNHALAGLAGANGSEASVGASAGQTSISGVPGNTSVDSSGRLNRRPSMNDRFRSDYMGGAAGGADSSTYNARDSNTNRLKQILEEPALRSLFREFLKQNFCEENLSFWLDVQDFKRRFHTTSSAVAVRPGTDHGRSGGGGVGGGGGGGVAGAVGRRLGRGNDRNASGQFGFTAMERHQQDLIAMAFVIYNTYLAPASPCELNIEHNLRSELVSYMNRILSSSAEGSSANGAGGPPGAESPGSTGGNGGYRRHGPPPGTAGSDTGSSGWASSGPAGAPGPASVPKTPLHASQLQTMVRLYERIQDHIFRLMATDSVPRFIKDPRFLSLVRSVEEYTEALESGRVDPRENSGPAIGKAVVDAMELPDEREYLRTGSGGQPSHSIAPSDSAAGGVGTVSTGQTLSEQRRVASNSSSLAMQHPTHPDEVFSTPPQGIPASLGPTPAQVVQQQHSRAQPFGGPPAKASGAAQGQGGGLGLGGAGTGTGTGTGEPPHQDAEWAHAHGGGFAK